MGWHNITAAPNMTALLSKMDEAGIAPIWVKQIIYEEDAPTDKKWKAIIFDPRI